MKSFPPTTCLHCEHEYVPQRVNQSYCSRACNRKAADGRRRIKYAEQLKQKSRDYYSENKEKWGSYREVQEAKIESDPAYAEKARGWTKTKTQNYHKSHPGYNAVKQERQRERKGSKRRDVARPYSSSTLLATARLLAKESRLAPSLEDGLLLQKAAQVLTTTAMMRLQPQSKPLTENPD